MTLRGDDEINSIIALMGRGSAPDTTSDILLEREETIDAIRGKDRSRKRKREKPKFRDTTSLNESHALKKPSFLGMRLTQNCFAWPYSSRNKQRSLILGPGLAHECERYIVDPNNDFHDSHYGSTPCHRCGRSSATHELCIEINSDSLACIKSESFSLTELIASIITAVRNARCVIGEYHVYDNSPAKSKCNINQSRLIMPPENSVLSTPEPISERLDIFVGRALAGVKKLSSNHSHSPKLHYGKNKLISTIRLRDAKILEEKMTELIGTTLDYKAAMINASCSNFNATNYSAARKLIDSKLIAMASCDAVYYRCYYTIITSCDAASANSCDYFSALIPHPPAFFSLPGMAWDSFDSARSTLSKFLGNSSTDNSETGKCDSIHSAPLDDFTRQLLLKSWHLKARLGELSTLQSNQDDHTMKENPLLILWQSRFLELIRHVWLTGYCSLVTPVSLSKCPFTSKTAVTSESQLNLQEKKLLHNETAAISMAVSKFRESIRDYPANFYAYATPTRGSLHAIVKHLNSVKGKMGLVEAGAGTGYWSSLILSCLQHNENQLQPPGTMVIPYDISPPSNWNRNRNDDIPNEYHGLIPTFTEVHQADSLESLLSDSRYQSTQSLMLCYPPPENDMAITALSTHWRQGGQYVIHIGEWQGLTGNAAFERLLTQHFTCEQSEPLPMWRTDATYLTIWNRKEKGEHPTSQSTFLSPAFGYCSSQPCPNVAKRRCRFARCLQYCSLSCFKIHDASRRAILALHMVRLSSNEKMDYDSNFHFIDLNPSF